MNKASKNSENNNDSEATELWNYFANEIEKL